MTEKEIFLNLKVFTKAKKFEIAGFDSQTNTLTIRVKSKPEKGLANLEAEKNLSKFFLAKTKIVSGKKSRNKKISVQNSGSILEKIKNLRALQKT